MFEESGVWEKDEDDLWPYQVPSVFVTRRKTVLAFADGRFGRAHAFSDATDNPGDFQPHHLVALSYDDHRSWPVSKVVFLDHPIIPISQFGMLRRSC